jgi:hypothetical protein
MPRPQRQKLKFELDSLEKHLQEIYNQLEELRTRAVKDYNRVIDLMKDPTNVGLLENSRNNALKTFDNYFQKKIELVKIQASIIGNIQKNSGKEGDGEGEVTTGSFDSSQMQKWYLEMKEGINKK